MFLLGFISLNQFFPRLEKLKVPPGVYYFYWIRNGRVITYRFIISLRKSSLNEPQSKKRSHSPAMLTFCLNQLIQICQRTEY